MNKHRTLIKGAAIVSMDAAIGDLPKGDVLIERDRIVAVRPSIAADDADTIDASQMLLLPGFINGHLHTWQTGLRGIAADWTVAEYMQAMHRGLATLFRPEDIYIANLMGALNQINNGATTLVDWCHNNPTPEHSDAAIRGLEEAGIRALFLHGSPKPDPKAGQRHFSEVPMPRREIERFCKGRFASREGLLTFGLAILGPYYSTYDVTVTDLALAREFDLLASMHVGGGTSLVPNGFERLLKDDLIDRHVTVVHGNDIAPDTVRGIVDRGGTFTVTAEIELQMGYGDPLTGILHSLNAPISIGTDVEPAVGSDLFTCMRLTLQHERNRSIIAALTKTGARPQRSPLTCRDALSWVTTEAARIAGLDDRTGSITPGKQADILLLRTDALNMVPMHDLVGCAVMQAGTANVDTVLIAGRVVKREGKLIVNGLAEKMAALRRSGERILSDFKRYHHVA
ncbi:MAG TPA: amidohydrolase family protein [Pseudolabrys sp.]|nr:amidohydrolase family protein [Pseudolabrys sp.]